MKFKKNHFLVGGLSLSIVNFSQKILNFILLPVFSNYLTPKDFGIVATFLLVDSVLGMFYNPGLISSTLRLYYDYDKDTNNAKKIIASTWVYLTLISIVVFVFSFFFGEKIIGLLFKEFVFWPYGFLAIFSAIFTQPISFSSTLWLSHDKTLYLAKISAFKIFINIAASIVFVIVIKLGALGRIIGFLSGNLFIYFFAFQYIYKYTKLDFSFKVLIKSLKAGLPLVFTVFSYVIFDASSRYIIEHKYGIMNLGIYDISYTLGSVPLIIVAGFQQLFTVNFYKYANENNLDSLNKILKTYLITLTFVTGIIMFFSKEVFTYLINKKFSAGIELVPFIALGIFFLGISNLFLTTMTYDKKFKKIGNISLIISILSISINLFFISKFNIFGAAVSCLFTYILYLIILYYSSRKNIYIKFKKIIPYLIIVISVFLISLVADLYFNLYLTISKLLFIILTILYLYFKYFKNLIFKDTL